MDAYNDRWYRYNNDDTYFILVNRRGTSIMPGEQVYFSYGKKSNSYLLENYGFTLDEKNIFAQIELRVKIGINPKEKVKSADVFYPDEKTLEDVENLETSTLLMRIKGEVISEGLLAYLREHLQNNFEGEDKKYIMATSPRVIEYELMVIDFALELLYAFPDSLQGKIFKQSSISQDQDSLKTSTDDEISTILQYNI